MELSSQEKPDVPETPYIYCVRKTPGKRLMALLLALILPAADCLCASGEIFSAVSSSPAASSAFSIPAGFGTIEEFIPGKAGKTVIYIQDAHDSLEAQESIARIVKHLTETQGITTVFEEGYEGPVPSDEYFSAVPDAEIRGRVAWQLMDELRIGGAEFAHITRRKDFDLVGADSVKLLMENIRWYREAAGLREEIEKDLAVLETHLQALAGRFYSGELKEFRKLAERREEGSLDLAEYLKRAAAFLEKTQAAGFEDYPNIGLLLEAASGNGQGAGIDAKALFLEMESFEDGVVRTLIRDEREFRIFRLEKGLRLLRRLAAVKVTQAEYEAVKNTLEELTAERIGGFVAEQIGRSLVVPRGWEDRIRRAVRFYELAHERDRVLDRRLTRFLEGKNQSAVLVFGGFHKAGILAMLRSKGISCMVVTPHMTKVSERHAARYRDLMSRGVPAAGPDAVREAARYIPVYVEGEFLGRSEEIRSGILERAAALSELREDAGEESREDRIGVLLSLLGNQLDGNRLNPRELDQKGYRDVLKKIYERLNYLHQLARDLDFAVLARTLESIDASLPDDRIFDPARETVRQIVEIARGGRSELREESFILNLDATDSKHRAAIPTAVYYVDLFRKLAEAGVRLVDGQNRTLSWRNDVIGRLSVRPEKQLVEFTGETGEAEAVLGYDLFPPDHLLYPKDVEIDVPGLEMEELPGRKDFEFVTEEWRARLYAIENRLAEKAGKALPHPEFFPLISHDRVLFSLEVSLPKDGRNRVLVDSLYVSDADERGIARFEILQRHPDRPEEYVPLDLYLDAEADSSGDIFVVEGNPEKGGRIGKRDNIDRYIERLTEGTKEHLLLRRTFVGGRSELRGKPLVPQPGDANPARRENGRHTTGFFRPFLVKSRQLEDYEAFLDAMAERAKLKGRVRILSAGASDGSEAYSTAMLLAERGVPLESIEIIGVDDDEASIETAKKGVYSSPGYAPDMLHVLQRYSSAPDVALYEIRPEIRERVRFFQGDLLDGFTYEPLGRFDGIMFMNVAYLLSPWDRKEAIAHLKEASEDDALLFSNAGRGGGYLYIRDPAAETGFSVYGRSELRYAGRSFYDLQDVFHREIGTPQETEGKLSFLDLGARYGRQVIALTDDLRRRMGYRDAFGVGIDLQPMPHAMYVSGISPGENYVVADATKLETDAPGVLARGPYDVLLIAAPDMKNIDFKTWLEAGKRYLKDDGIFLIGFTPEEGAALKKFILQALQEAGLHYHWFSEDTTPLLYRDSHQLGPLLLAGKAPLKGDYGPAPDGRSELRTLEGWRDVFSSFREPAAREFWLSQVRELEENFAQPDDVILRIPRTEKHFDPTLKDPQTGIVTGAGPGYSSIGYSIAAFFDPENEENKALVDAASRLQRQILEKFGRDKIVLVPSGHDPETGKALSPKGSLHLTLEGIETGLREDVPVEKLAETAGQLRSSLEKQPVVRGELVGPFWHKDLGIVLVWDAGRGDDPLLAARQAAQQVLGRESSVRPFHVTLAYRNSGALFARRFEEEYSLLEGIETVRIPVTISGFEVNGYRDIAFINTTRTPEAVISLAPGGKSELRGVDAEEFERMKTLFLDRNREPEEKDWQVLRDRFSNNQLAMLAMVLSMEENRTPVTGAVLLGPSVFEKRREGIVAIIRTNNTSGRSELRGAGTEPWRGDTAVLRREMEDLAANARRIFFELFPETVPVWETIEQQSGYSFAQAASSLVNQYIRTSTLNKPEIFRWQEIMQGLREERPALEQGLQAARDLEPDLNAVAFFRKLAEYASEDTPLSLDFARLLGRFRGLELLRDEDVPPFLAIQYFLHPEDGELARLPLVDLTSGGGRSFISGEGSESERPVVFIDYSIFAASVLEAMTEKRPGRRGRYTILRQDVRRLDEMIAPESAGTIMMRGTGQYVELPEEWYDRLPERVAPGGQVVLALRIGSFGHFPASFEDILQEVERTFPPEHLHSDRVVLKRLAGTLLDKGWDITWGAVNAEGRFVEGMMGGLEDGHYSETFIIFQKPRSELRGFRERFTFRLAPYGIDGMVFTAGGKQFIFTGDYETSLLGEEGEVTDIRYRAFISELMDFIQTETPAANARGYYEIRIVYGEGGIRLNLDTLREEKSIYFPYQDYRPAGDEDPENLWGLYKEFFFLPAVFNPQTRAAALDAYGLHQFAPSRDGLRRAIFSAHRSELRHAEKTSRDFLRPIPMVLRDVSPKNPLPGGGRVEMLLNRTGVVRLRVTLPGEKERLIEQDRMAGETLVLPDGRRIEVTEVRKFKVSLLVRWDAGSPAALMEEMRTILRADVFRQEAPITAFLEREDTEPVRPEIVLYLFTHMNHTVRRFAADLLPAMEIAPDRLLRRLGTPENSFEPFGPPGTEEQRRAYSDDYTRLNRRHAFIYALATILIPPADEAAPDSLADYRETVRKAAKAAVEEGAASWNEEKDRDLWTLVKDDPERVLKTGRDLTPFEVLRLAVLRHEYFKNGFAGEKRFAEKDNWLYPNVQKIYPADGDASKILYAPPPLNASEKPAAGIVPAGIPAGDGRSELRGEDRLPALETLVRRHEKVRVFVDAASEFRNEQEAEQTAAELARLADAGAEVVLYHLEKTSSDSLFYRLLDSFPRGTFEFRRGSFETVFGGFDSGKRGEVLIHYTPDVPEEKPVPVSGLPAAAAEKLLRVTGKAGSAVYGLREIEALKLKKPLPDRGIHYRDGVHFIDESASSWARLALEARTFVAFAASA